MSLPRPVLTSLVLIASAAPALAQSNAVPGQDVQLSNVQSMTAVGRTGTFPNGMNGCAMSTTACNPGTVQIPWVQAMAPDHPFISFIVARQNGDRFIQISDRSYIKHGFLATNSPGCGTCQNPGTGSKLGINCGDTYGVGNNGDNFWLGPADELDPWLGIWTVQCSHFDKGEPPVAAPFDCDGNRSLTQTQATALGPVGHRVHLADADLTVAGSQFFYQGMYLIKGEAEANRGNNLASRQMNVAFTGTNWSFATVGGQIAGTILNRWTGATVNSSTNGGDDGRVYVAVKVTNPAPGTWHYEYAVHNRDNARGVGAVHLPIAPCASATNFFFHDVDTNPGNDWTATRTPTEVVFSTGTDPLRWNSFYNFAFDSDTPPAAGSAQIDEFFAGTGAPSFPVATTGPLSLPFASYGTGTPGCSGAHTICGLGAPQVGNAAFALHTDNGPPSSLGLLLLADVSSPGVDPFNLGVTLLVDLFASGTVLAGDINVDALGNADVPLPVPGDPGLAGLTINGQGLFGWLSGPCSPSPANLSSTNGIAITFLP